MFLILYNDVRTNRVWIMVNFTTVKLLALLQPQQNSGVSGTVHILGYSSRPLSAIGSDLDN